MMRFLSSLTAIPFTQWLRDVGSFTHAHLLKTPIARFFIPVVLPLFYRGQIDQAIAQSEQLFATFMDNLPGFVWMKDLDGRYVYVNQHLKRLAPYQNGWLGKTDAEILPGEIAATCRENDQKVIATGEKVESVESFVLNGEQRHLLVSKFPIFDEHGTVIMVGGTSVDTTEHKRVEEALRESESFRRMIIESEPECVKLVAPDYTLLDMNPAGLKMIEATSREQVIGQSVLNLIAPQSRSLFMGMHERVCQGESLVTEFEMVGLKGSRRWMESHAAPLLDKESKVIARLAITLDVTERKRAEERLRRSERQLDEAQRIAHIGSWSWDVNSKTQIWSDELYRIYGLQPGKVAPTYEAFLALVHTEDRLLLGESVERAVRTREPIDLYLRIIRPDGEERIIHSRGRIVYDDQGNPITKFGTAQDVTEYRRAEEALRAAERKYRDIFENAAEGIFQTTPDGRFISANPALVKMFGFGSLEELIRERSDISGQHYVDPKCREEFKRRLEEQGVVKGFELQAYRKDGSTIWLSENVRAVRDEVGKVLYYEGTTQDITERRQADHSLRLFRTLIDRSSDAIEVMDPNTLRFLDCNETAYQSLGYTREEFLSLSAIDIDPIIDQSMSARLAEEIDKSSFVIFESVHRRKDGSTFPVEINVKVVRLERKYRLAVVRDIAERKRAEESLRKQNEYLAALHETALGLINRLDLDELLEDIVTRACALVDIPGGYVYLIEPGGTGMRVKVGVGVSRDFVGALIRKGEGLAGRIWQTGKPLVVDDYRNWEHRLTDAGYDVLLTGGAVPLRSGSQVVGVLGVESTEDGQGLGEHQIEILNRFAQLASIALDNAQLHSAVQQELAERKRAGEELRASEERYRELFEQASDVIFKTDARGNWGSFNPAAVKLLKYGEKELTGKYYLDLVKPEYRSAVKGFYQEQFRTKTPNTRYEFPAIAKDGTEVWIEQRATLLFENDQAAGFHLVARDITERKRAEAALRESEERYRDLVENSREFICTHDLNGLILSANRAASEVLGYDLKDYCGKKNYRDLLVPEVRDQFDDYLARLRRDGVASGLTLVQTSSGERRILEYHNTVRTEGVATPIVRGMARDITEQRRAEKAMSVLRHELELTMNTMEEGVHRVDLKGNIVFENPAAARMLGWEVDELLGKRAHPTMHHTRADGTPYPKEECPIYATFRDGVSRHVADEVFWRRDGTSFPVEYMTAPMRNDRNEIVAAIVTFRDITERKAAEEKLKANSEQLRALSARLLSAREEEGTRIAREIHDELGSALTGLKWDLEGIDKILSTPVEPSELAALREKLHGPMKLADTAISAIRRIASELRPSVLDDLGLVAAIEWQAQQFQARTGIVCDCSLEKVELTEEQSTAVFRIFQEALTNILRHAQATKVDIKINKEHGYFALSVSDNGKGITESEKSEQQSLGILGMRERAHLIEGEIDIKGVERKGTVVIVRVPISGQEMVLKMTR